MCKGVTDRYMHRQLKLDLHELYRGYMEGGRWQDRSSARNRSERGLRVEGKKGFKRGEGKCMKTYYYDAKVTEGFCMVIKNRSGQGLRRRVMMIDIRVSVWIKDTTVEMSDGFNNELVYKIYARENFEGSKKRLKKRKLLVSALEYNQIRYNQILKKKLFVSISGYNQMVLIQMF